MTAFDLDLTIRPQDDLYRHVNGPWLATAQIPDDKPATGAFNELRDAAEVAIRDIVTGLSGSEPGSEAAKVEHLYGSFMDSERVDYLGLEPLAPLLAEIDAIASLDDLFGYFARSLRRGTGAPFTLDIDSDPGDPSRYALFLYQDGIGLPDEEYFRLEQHASVLTSYRDHVDQTMTMAGLTASASPVVVGLEAEVAGHHWDKVRTRDLVALYNPTPLADLDATGLPWSAILAAAGVPIDSLDTVIVAQPSFVEALPGLLTPSRLEDWKAWARWTLVSSMSPYLPDAMAQNRFDFYGTVLQGTPVMRDRWKRGVDLVERFLGEAVGKLYVERHFSPVAKQRMDVLVANLIEAYRSSIGSLDWMTDQTRAEALHKLSKFTPKIGYPEIWKDYSGLEIVPDDLFGNVLRAHEFVVADEISKLGGPIRRHEWLMTPQTVNAYYHPLRNEIVFPAAILQPPFFDPEADDAVNYGGIGAVIGHEIGHGFDDQGSSCDGDGRLRDWWTPADKDAFTARTTALVAQYDALCPAQLPDVHVNGSLTLGENIGDLGGAGIAYQAWRLATGGVEPEPIDGLTGAQRFFLSYGRIWQSKTRDEALAQRVATDPHSPNEFRANQVVRNIDAFYSAFGVTEADAAWLPAQQRVSIW
ncbi:MAG: M13-type metalloendopeptidase [Propionicimonas sp.]|uniref:M13 family metallopeptidase n=1 Tax=Propionicimonas sp. TaxID=1955623 RepID=UPI002B202B0B|nr:M13-type metalloendopeptidase [Propionicimonas sp.]MEA4943738.1 M13-type metalloendopeptidase [Propionicimonas sp.]